MKIDGNETLIFFMTCSVNKNTFGWSCKFNLTKDCIDAFASLLIVD